MSSKLWSKLKRMVNVKLWQLWLWLDGLTIEQCANCGRYTVRSNTTVAKTTWGAYVRLCNPCHRELYPDQYWVERPFTHK